nr:unnamed protein product [Callosobruchus analis]
MGSTGSSLSVLTQDILEEYTILTYLNKSEILHLYKLFSRLDRTGQLQNLEFRFPPECIENMFPQIQFNPFKDRILKVFSSEKDEKLSFEDMLDLCSVMSDKCPDKVKAAWAFRILDFDEDECIGEQDLTQVINRLTGDEGQIQVEEQKHIIDILLNEIDISSTGKIGQLEFMHAVGKISDFPNSFCFRL